MTSPGLLGKSKAAFLAAARNEIQNENSDHQQDREEVLALLTAQHEITLDDITQAVRTQYRGKISGIQMNKETAFFNLIFSKFSAGESKPSRDTSGFESLPAKRQLATVAYARTAESVEAWKNKEWDRVLRKGVGKTISEIINNVLRLPSVDISESDVMQVLEDVLKQSDLTPEAENQIREEFTDFLSRTPKINASVALREYTR